MKNTASFLHPRLTQQAQLCFLYIVLFDLCQKYVAQYKHIFIIQQGFWYFENEVSSITNKGLLSGVCHHMGVNGKGREGEVGGGPLCLYLGLWPQWHEL